MALIKKILIRYKMLLLLFLFITTFFLTLNIHTCAFNVKLSNLLFNMSINFLLYRRKPAKKTSRRRVDWIVLLYWAAQDSCTLHQRVLPS